MSSPPTDPFEHIHLGAGKLGLGLVLPTALDAGARVHLVVHAGSRLQPEATFVCLVVDASGGRTRRELGIASFSSAATADDLHEDALAALADAPELLITTAITSEGISAQWRFLVELAKRRRGRPTIFIACENDCGPDYPGLVEQLRALDVDVRRTVVNRVCSDLGDEDELREGEHAVRAFEHAEWIVEGAPVPGLLAALASVTHVSFTEHIEAHEVRKRWLVNGAHLAIGLLAGSVNQVTINGATAALQAERDGWVDRLHDAVSAPIERRHPVLSETRAYAREQTAVFLQHEEEVHRILRRLKRADLLPFLVDFDRKLGEPARAIVEDGGSLPPELRTVLDALDTTLADIGQYRDYDRFLARDMHLSAAADQAVVERYRQLLAPLLEPRDTATRTTALRRALRMHRVQLESA